MARHTLRRGPDGRVQSYSAEDREAIFWTRVDRSGGSDACWPWLAACNTQRGGYGYFRTPGLRSSSRAHRVAWALANGPIPVGLHVLHRCDNPPCCNPAHLFLGTQRDNMQDMRAKGRGRSGTAGLPSPWRKLTDDQADVLRARFADGVLLRVLSRDFGIAMQTASRIVRRKSYVTPSGMGGVIVAIGLCVGLPR